MKFKKYVSVFLTGILMLSNVSFVSANSDNEWWGSSYAEYLVNKNMYVDWADLSVANDVIIDADTNNVTTREEGISKLAEQYNIQPISEFNKKFVDDEEIDEKYKEMINTLYNLNIITGIKDKFEPKKGFTKAEFITLTYMLERYTNSDYEKSTIQHTANGVVKGYLSEDKTVINWKGINYADNPVGDLRWNVPQPYSNSWSGIEEKIDLKDKFIQYDGMSNQLSGSEELYVNVTRPNTDEKNLPVLVFVHGGNNQTGTPEELATEMLANKTNSVIVTMTYRIGALGNLNLPALKTDNEVQNSGNFGLLDIHESLNWVNENVENFGGDKDNVTVSGFSAGARNVANMVVSPYFENTFNKAIIMSGGLTTSDYGKAQEIAATAFAKLVLEDNICETEEEAIKWIQQNNEEVTEYLYSLDSGRITALMTNASIRMDAFPHLIKDGVVIPKDGFNENSVNVNNAPIIVGANENEFTMFAAFDPMFMMDVMSGTIFEDMEKLQAMNFAMDYGSQLYKVFSLEETAQFFDNVENNNDVYGYRVLYGNNAGDLEGLGQLLKAYHGMDLAILTGKRNDMIPFGENEVATYEINEYMNDYLYNFLRDGNPNEDNIDVTWETFSSDEILSYSNEGKTAIIKMSEKAMTQEEIINNLMNDNSINEETKKEIVQNVLNGRFFSDKLDINIENN